MTGKKDPAHTVLIATLGTEPQVVTITLDLLQRRKERVGDVVVIHTAPVGAIGSALARLRTEFATYPAYQTITLRLVCLSVEEQPLADVDSPMGATLVFRALYQEVLRYKRIGRRVHLSIAGGRKTMAVYGMATAQLLFDEGDHLWHLVSEGDLLAQKRLHPEPDDLVQLIPIPVLRWSSIAPVATELVLTEDPFDALARQDRFRKREDLWARASFVRDQLTPAERELVALIVREGVSNAEAGRRLSRSPKTVANQLSSVYGKLHTFFGLREDVAVGRAMLIALFSPYFSSAGAESGTDSYGR
jgi:CRISPR-associated Csx14 family protein